MQAPFKRILPLLAALALGACTYAGGDIGDPAVRKFHWFSFVGGDDIRAHCASGTPDRFRLVYNAIYHEQIRIYELDSLRQLLSIKVVGPENASRVRSDDLLAPWRAVEAKVQLDDATYSRLVASFAGDSVFGPAPVGLELPSRSYYWLAATCRDGRFGLTAWAHPSEGFDRLVFPSNMFSLDPTGIPVKAAADIPVDPLWNVKARRGEVTEFTLKIGADGLVR